MPTGVDALVIGGGIVGCAVACELALGGRRVCLLERRSLGGGATQASAGMLAPFLEGHGRSDFLSLAVRSLGLYDGFVDRVRAASGRDVEYRRAGSLQVALDDDLAVHLRRTAGVPPAEAEWLDAAGAREAEPWLAPSARGALRVTAHGYVGVESLTMGLAEAARRAGASVNTGVDVVSLSVADAGLVVQAADGRRWAAPHVIAAAGSWSGSDALWNREVGDVYPVKGQIVRLRTDPSAINHVLWGPDCYVVPWHDGTVLVGATEESAGFDERVTGGGVGRMLQAGRLLLPPLADATFLEARAGLRPGTSDGLPIIGPSQEVPGLIYATGHFRNGVLLAPLTASLVNACLEGISDPALDLVRPGRTRPAPSRIT
jgi:glycine oxidase